MSDLAVLPPPRPSTILRPGLRSLPFGTERYVVRGGGSLTVRIAAGDRLKLVDIEGLQPAELLATGPDGRPDTGILGVPGGKPMLCVFGTGPAGETCEFTVQRDGLLKVSAPGGAMDFVRQNTATDLLLFIVRANPVQYKSGMTPLPDPLRDPLQDIRVRAATARAFTVKAGEYIQIIDVDGRQMTDFQCFSARKLEKGIENALDATVTRTLTGRALPTPGLPSKAFGFDFEPLVEVVQDTVGRHDAFATACNARYYDDVGYPGHVNCTENFNRALDPYGIARRRGWEALNFFYNTRMDAADQIVSDEAWSRPGDYVLLRALTDLVCVNSSCPDDIDPGNGWNPTDIHVRTYSAENAFSRAVAYRMTPDADPQMTKETAFHPRLSAMTRNFVEYRGYWLPSRFSNGGAIDEYWACRQKCVVLDLSPLRKFEVLGPDAEALLQYCLTRDIRKLGVGQVVYTAMCYPNGGMIDDGTVFRLGANNFRWIGGDDYGGVWLREQAEKMGYKAWVRSSTDQLHNIAVQGPESRDLMKEIIWTSPAQTAIGELEWFRFCVGRIGHFEGPPVVVSRTGYTGELGYEIFCHPKDAVAVFDAVWEAGQKRGIRPMGLEALDMVRIEAGLIFANYEFNSETDPFEAGIGFTVPLKSKAEDFIGRTALLERKEHPRRKLVGLEIDANEAVGHGDCVHIGRAQVGVVTSGMRSPLLGKTIALARVDALNASTGTEVEIGKLDGHAKRLPARIVRFPHYDPDKLRPRS
jgi:aminomethyltransferase